MKSVLNGTCVLFPFKIGNFPSTLRYKLIYKHCIYSGFQSVIHVKYKGRSVFPIEVSKLINKKIFQHSPFLLFSAFLIFLMEQYFPVSSFLLTIFDTPLLLRVCVDSIVEKKIFFRFSR